MIQITRIRHSWPEPDGVVLDRPHGSKEYILLHYRDPLLLLHQGQKIVTRPHAFHVLAPHTPQWFQVQGQLVHDWMHLTGDVAGLMAQFNLKPNTLYYPKNPAEITAFVHDLENEFSAGRAFYPEAIQAKLSLLFLTVSRCLTESRPVVSADSQTEKRLRQLRMKMMLSLEEEWNIKKMASEAAVSPSWFYPLYRSVFGISPMQDLILCRIEKARELLEARDISLTELCRLCGYSSEFHLIRQFKAVTGTTPKQYRLQVRQNK